RGLDCFGGAIHAGIANDSSDGPAREESPALGLKNSKSVGAGDSHLRIAFLQLWGGQNFHGHGGTRESMAGRLAVRIGAARDPKHASALEERFAGALKQRLP